MLLARRFTLNPVLVVISLVFWFWMWGIRVGSMRKLVVTLFYDFPVQRQQASIASVHC